MKKFLVIPLLFLYMMASTGIMVQLHYCGEQIESWGFNWHSDGCKDDSCKEEKEKEGNCCKDKIIASKITTDQVVTAQTPFSFSEKYFLLPTIDYPVFQESLTLAPVAAPTYQANAPPGNWQQIPLYKLHSSLTYYG